jgi:hypothetical protein
MDVHSAVHKIEKWFYSLKTRTPHQDHIDPITFSLLDWNRGVFPFFYGSSPLNVIFYQAESIAQYILSDGKFIDPSSTLPYSQRDIKRLCTILERYGHSFHKNGMSLYDWYQHNKGQDVVNENAMVEQSFLTVQVTMGDLCARFAQVISEQDILEIRTFVNTVFIPEIHGCLEESLRMFPLRIPFLLETSFVCCKPEIFMGNLEIQSIFIDTMIILQQYLVTTLRVGTELYIVWKDVTDIGDISAKIQEMVSVVCDSIHKR